jgi:hypothetical protein
MSFEMFKSGKLHFSKIEVSVMRCLVEKRTKAIGPALAELFEIGTAAGLKDQDEAKIVSELLINILNNITINITKDICHSKYLKLHIKLNPI